MQRLLQKVLSIIAIIGFSFFVIITNSISRVNIHRVILIFFILFIANPIAAQNLIRNGSFEEYYTCPNAFSTTPGKKLIPHWYSPDSATPDYFNECGMDEVSVPNNWAGVSRAFSGKGYVGLYLWSKNTNYKEYLNTDLDTPLVAGEKYIIRFMYKLSSYSMVAIDRIGVRISAEDGLDNATIPGYGRYDYYKIKENTVDRYTGGWEIFEDTIQAKGGENVISIGNYSAKNEINMVFLPEGRYVEPMLLDRAYYYIDQVELWSLSTILEKEKKLKEVFPTDSIMVFQEVLFDFDQYNLLPQSFSELDDLAFHLLGNPKLNLEIRGHTDEAGSRIYNQNLSENRANSVKEYLVFKGVEAHRILALGFGETQIKETNNDLLNRRVEFILLSK